MGIESIRWLAATCVVALTASETAGQRFARHGFADLPSAMRAAAGALFVGDVDGDGAPDLVQDDGVAFGNAGFGRFVVLGSPRPRTVCRAVVDIDGDGRDELIGQVGGVVEVWHLVSPDRFERRVSLVADMLEHFVLADIDGVPGPELVGVGDDTVSCWRFDTGGRLVPMLEPQPFQSDFLSAIVVGDLDGDGHGDLVLCRRGFRASRMWLGDGRGKFEERDLGLLQFTTLGARLVDVDGDGDLDVVGRGEWLQLLLNDGAANFTDVSGARLPADPALGAVEGLHVADFDGDGDADLAVEGQAWLVNDGSGRFRFNVGIDVALPERPLAVADLDGDGDIDVLGVPRRIWWNDGSGRLQPVADPLPAARLDGRVLADLDGDGRIDLLGAPGEVWMGGAGGFTRRDVSAALRSPARWHPLPIDVDGDGDRDLLVSIPGRASIVLENRGNGDYGIAAFDTPRLTASEQDGALVGADLDGDGDQDVIHVAPDGTAEILVNTGDALEVDDLMLFRGTRVRSLVAVDYDRDGEVELIGHALGQFGARGDTVVWRRYRRGPFLIARSIYGAGPVLTVADFDGDGGPDVVSCDESAGSTRVVMHLGTRFDGFDRIQQLELEVPGVPRRVVACDVDADGDRDVIVVGDEDGLPYSRWLANDGTGFLTVRPPSPGDDRIPAFAAYDVDGDGDEDLIAEDGIHVNLRRQIRLLRSVRVGGPFSLACDARFERPESIGILVFAAPARTAQPRDMPAFGELWLDPNLLFPVFWVAARENGPTLVEFPIPSDARLVGARFALQALFQETATWRLGNVAEATVLR